MKKKMIDPNMPIGDLVRIKDMLPPPSKLVFPEDNVKVTIELGKSSVVFFKKQARRHHTKYQRMIRAVLDKYAVQYKASK